MGKGLTPASIVLALCVGWPVAFAGRLITVDDDGRADFATIAAAVSDANTGDEILVKDGTYAGRGNYDIDFAGKSVIVRSENGPGATIIDCRGEGYGFYIRGDRAGRACIEGFTIRHAILGAVRCYGSILVRVIGANATQGSQIGPARYHFGYAPVVISNCRILENGDGGVLLDSHDNVTIANCYIAENSTAGVWAYMSSPTISNCVVVENDGVGIRTDGGGVVSSCTIARNGSIGLWISEGTVMNSIVWGNRQRQLYNPADDVSVTYSDVQGGRRDQGNIDAEPLFADPAGGDYHLKSQAGRWEPAEQVWIMDDVSSPCIDAGDPRGPIGFEPFPNGGVVNIGAYGGTTKASKSYFGGPVCQTVVAGDINGDCKVDFVDLELMVANWLSIEPLVGNRPPTVRIVQPKYGNTIGIYHQDDPIEIRADACDVDGRVVRVEFYFEGGALGMPLMKIGEDPDGADGWQVNWVWWGQWGHYPEGDYILTAIATDDDGARTLSGQVLIHVHGPK